LGFTSEFTAIIFPLAFLLGGLKFQFRKEHVEKLFPFVGIVLNDLRGLDRSQERGV
jgi:hypothetical protein